jgi:hypothetical protein
MPSDLDSNGRNDSPGVPSPPSSDQVSPAQVVLETIGHGFAALRSPGTLDGIPFPPDDSDRMTDYDWAQDDPNVRARFGGLVVAVRHRQVWGAGRTPQQANQDAARKSDCPQELVYVFVWPGPIGEDQGNGTG